MRRSALAPTWDVPGLPRVCDEIVYPHVFGTADREVGGVLVGCISDTGGLPLVTGAIEALHADERRSALTFTQEAWEHVHRRLETDFHHDDQIVGWYHSHPGFGIFLSDDDLFIHRHFFSGPSQIALVVDPLEGTEGVFVWDGDEIVALPLRSTAAPWSGLAPRGAPEQPAERVSVYRHREPYPVVVLALALILGALIGFGAWNLASGGSPRAAEATPTPAHARAATR